MAKLESLTSLQVHVKGDPGQAPGCAPPLCFILYSYFKSIGCVKRYQSNPQTPEFYCAGEEWGSFWSTTFTAPHPPNPLHIHVLDCKYYVSYNHKNNWNSNVCRGPSRPDCACVSLFTATGGLLTISWRGGEGSIIYSVLGCDKIAYSNTMLPNGSS